jgi:hypothetical protein
MGCSWSSSATMASRLRRLLASHGSRPPAGPVADAAVASSVDCRTAPLAWAAPRAEKPQLAGVEARMLMRATHRRLGRNEGEYPTLTLRQHGPWVRSVCPPRNGETFADVDSGEFDG